MQYQIHFGRKFYLDVKTGYWISCSCPKIRAHRWVWIHTIGNIKKGLHIHHIDGNKSNNDINNLRLVTPKNHISLHMNDDRKKRASEFMGKIRHLTKDWHSSPEGIQWHKKHALTMNLGHFDLPFKDCNQCKVEYKPKNHRQNFCSNKCKSAWRRKMKFDEIEFVCLRCSSKFKRNKYAKSRFCSKICSMSFNWNENKIHKKIRKERECILPISK